MERIYKSSGVGLAAFLGGPIAAGYLLFKNYKSFNKNEHAKTALAISAFITTVTVVGLLLLPENIARSIPNFLFPLIFAVLGRWFTEKYQKEDMDLYVSNGGEFYSDWRAAGVSLVFTFAIVVAAIFIYVLLDLLFLS